MKLKMPVSRCCCVEAYPPPGGEQVFFTLFPLEFMGQFPSTLGTETNYYEFLARDVSGDWDQGPNGYEIVRRRISDTQPGEYQETGVLIHFKPSRKPVQRALMHTFSWWLYANTPASVLWGDVGYYSSLPYQTSWVTAYWRQDDNPFPTTIHRSELLNPTDIAWPNPFPYGTPPSADNSVPGTNVAFTVDLWPIVQYAVNDPLYVPGESWIQIILYPKDDELNNPTVPYAFNSLSTQDPAGPIPQGNLFGATEGDVIELA